MTDEELKQMELNTKLVLSLMNLTEEISKDYEGAKTYINSLADSLGNLSLLLKQAGYPQQILDILEDMSKNAKNYAGQMQNLVQKHIGALSRFEFANGQQNNPKN